MKNSYLSANSLLNQFKKNYIKLFLFVSLNVFLFNSVDAQNTSPKTLGKADRTTGERNINTGNSFIYPDYSHIEVREINGVMYVKNGLFEYKVTGNANADAKLYLEAKEKFISSNPVKYKEWVGENTSLDKLSISKEEFNKLPESKKNYILANPNKYSVN